MLYDLTVFVAIRDSLLPIMLYETVVYLCSVIALEFKIAVFPQFPVLW